MAEIDVTRSRGAGDAVVERTGFRLSWGAIAAGFVVATALQMALTVLGLAVGFVAFDPLAGDSFGAAGTWAGVWFAITAVASLFLGGLTTGRLAGVLTPGDGRLHGVVVWGLSTLLAVYFATMAGGRVLGGAFSFASQATTAVATTAVGAVGQVGAAAVGEAGSPDLQRLRTEIEAALRQTGDPALRPDSLAGQAQAVQGEALGDTDNRALAAELADRVRRTAGRVDREDLLNVVVARTGMDRAEADRVVTRIEQAAAGAGGDLAQTADAVQEGAGEAAADAANALAKAAWTALLVMGLSLVAAVAGGGMTARR